jgi:hypothetical protein
MQHLEGSSKPVLYTGRMVLKRLTKFYNLFTLILHLMRRNLTSIGIAEI